MKEIICIVLEDYGNISGGGSWNNKLNNTINEKINEGYELLTISADFNGFSGKLSSHAIYMQKDSVKPESTLRYEIDNVLNKTIVLSKSYNPQTGEQIVNIDYTKSIEELIKILR